VDLTSSWQDAVPSDVLERYEFMETRNAAAVLASTNPKAFGDLLDALRSFTLLTGDLVDAGGNESKLAARLNRLFRERGWRETRADVVTVLTLTIHPYAPAGESQKTTIAGEEVSAVGFKVDNFKDRVALDVEWNAKDGNLDRDVGAYRAWYDLALIDVGVIITRTQNDIRDLAKRLAMAAGATEAEAKRRFGTTTTTNFDKLRPRLERGDGGGCPILAVGICARTWDDDTKDLGVL